MSRDTLRAALCAAALLVASAASAAPRLTYSGTLQDGGGRPVTGAAVLQFRFYHQAEGGTPAWEDAVAVAPDTNGWFSTILGATPLNPIDPEVFTTAVWLGIQVGTDTVELTPRMPVTSAPDAVHAAVASSVPWSGVTGAPTSFPPAAHAHAENEVSSVAWTSVTGAPTAFPPAAHAHAENEISSVGWASVTGKPASFPPAVTPLVQGLRSNDGLKSYTTERAHQFCAVTNIEVGGTFQSPHGCGASCNPDRTWTLRVNAGATPGGELYCEMSCF